MTTSEAVVTVGAEQHVMGAHELSIVIRPPQPEDAVAMNELYIDRRADTSPGNPGYDKEKIAWALEHGVDKYTEVIGNTLANPEQYFTRIAAVGGAVVGYARAEAPQGEPFTWWRGLIVARATEGIGIGRQLEADRRAWAQGIGRPVRGLIVVGNNRSMNFFQRQGFEQVATQAATPEQPLRFNVMELGLAALNG